MTVQRDDETENEFAMRVESCANSCHGVFTESDLVNYSLRGLLPQITKIVQFRVHEMAPEHRRNVSKVSQIAEAQGHSMLLMEEHPTNFRMVLNPRSLG